MQNRCRAQLHWMTVVSVSHTQGRWKEHTHCKQQMDCLREYLSAMISAVSIPMRDPGSRLATTHFAPGSMLFLLEASIVVSAGPGVHMRM